VKRMRDDSGVSIAGNVSVRQINLGRHSDDAFNWQPVLLVADHPYLDGVTAIKRRWRLSFADRGFFVAALPSSSRNRRRPSAWYQDRSMYEDYEVFVKGLVGARAFWDTVIFTHVPPLAQALTPLGRAATLMIYTCAPVLPALLGRYFVYARRRKLPEYLGFNNRLLKIGCGASTFAPYFTIDTDRLGLD